MRLREREKRSTTVYAPAGGDDDAYTWGEGTVIRAALYPAEYTLTPQAQGDALTCRWLLLCDGGAALQPGMGVSLDGGAPSLRIVSVERWQHTRAMLEEIPEGRRGDAAGV